MFDKTRKHHHNNNNFNNRNCRRSPDCGPVCRWDFLEYRASEYEQFWVNNVKNLQDGDICSESNKHVTEIDQWMALATSGHATLPLSVFSRYVFRNNCSGEELVDYIEPLAGLTRSPLYCLKGNNYVVRKDYLVVSWNVSRKISRNAYYFDLGASMYNSGGGGPSQSWFVETYESRGIEWDGIYAWEASEYTPAVVWDAIPARLKPIYHWYNIAVNPLPNHTDNPLEYIRRIARPEDFVLLKIDIDNTPVEEALVFQFMESAELLGLVDEFYFEHHVNVAPMHRHWGSESLYKKLEDTYSIFTTLRKNGVIAHSWV